MLIMASCRKFHGRGKDACSREDTISRLPDPILCHMLSFLPTKDAVRTSILSKRWNNVWTSVPCIEIEQQFSLARYWTWNCIHRSKCLFMKFVDRVLQLNDVHHLRKFCLISYEYYDYSSIRESMRAVIKRDIEELDLGLKTYPAMLPLYPSIFTSKNLISLRLRDLGNTALSVPAMVNLPSLKILHINSVVLTENDSMQKLLDGCPIIEKLNIEIGFCYEGTTLFVRSSSLRSLRVHGVHSCSTENELRIVLDASNLKQLDLEDDIIFQYDVINLSSLVEVKLDFCGTCSGLVKMDIYGNRLVELLRKFSNANYLIISCQMMKSLKYARWDDLPSFHNVTHLELKTFEYSWPVWPALLECFPKLITFVFHKEGSCGGHLPFLAPKFSILYLEDVKLTGFKGYAEEIEMVRYFLKNATVLKKLCIQFGYSEFNKQSEITKKLLTLPRGSTECIIIFK